MTGRPARQLDVRDDAVARFAELDPDVDWPSEQHATAGEAVCAALDETRERVRVVVGHVDRGLAHVRNALGVLGPQLPTSKGKPARASRELNAGAAALKSALYHAGDLPAGALLVDERPRVDGAPAELDDVDAELAGRASTFDRAAVAAGRVVLNLSAIEADDLLELVDADTNRARQRRLAGVQQRLELRAARARAYLAGATS